jgi:hypothetical protein
MHPDRPQPLHRPTPGASAHAGPAVRGIELRPSLAALRRTTPPPARSVVRSVARAYGTATASRRRLPDYLIIGAKKGGTSSLTNWLLQHPGTVHMFPPFQRLKSAHFFDINFYRGVDWYRGHFPSDRVPRHHDRDRPAIVGEASPYYLFHPAAATRAASVVPDARILAVLRDPVSRAYSNYCDRVAAGHETLASFEEALGAEHIRRTQVDDERLLHDPGYYSYEHDHHTYLARGRYLEQLQRWLREFPREQVLVLCAEEMYADPAGTFAQVQRFLGLEPCPHIDLRCYNGRTKPPLSDHTRRSLAAYYRPHNHALYDFLGRDLGWETGRA